LSKSTKKGELSAQPQTRADGLFGETGSRSIPKVPTSSSSDFEQWLEVDWFYPKGFGFRGLAVEEDCLTCLGENQKIIFELPQSFGSHIFPRYLQERVSGYFRQYELNKPFAPQHLDGLVLIEWLDGEPYWAEEIRFSEFSKDVLKFSECSEIGLVLNEQVSQPSLAELLRSPADPQLIEAVRSLGGRISGYHKETQGGSEAWSGSEMGLLEDIAEFVVDDLADFAIKCLPFIDRLHAKMFNEARYWLNLNLEKALHLVSGRFSRGKFCYVHGNIRFSNCFFFPTEPVGIELRGRKVSLLADPFLDLADFSVELELAGLSTLSEELIEGYLPPDSEDSSERILFAYFKQLHLLNRYYSLIIENNSLEEDDFAGRCEKILSLSSAVI